MPSTEVKQTPEIHKASSRQEAVERLIEKGDLLRFNDLEVWHGRASFGEEWKVGPVNEYKQSPRILYKGVMYGTLHKQDAQDFAVARSRRHSQAEPSLHQIVAISDESLLLTQKTVEAVLPKQLVGSAKKFASEQEWYSKEMNKIISDLLEDRSHLIKIIETHDAAEAAGVDEDALRDYVGVVNSYLLLTHFPLKYSIGPVLYGRDHIDAGGTCDISPEFIYDVLTQNNIIGSKEDNVRSATLNRHTPEVVIIWDFDAVQDKEVHEEQKKQLGRTGLKYS